MLKRLILAAAIALCTTPSFSDDSNLVVEWKEICGDEERDRLDYCLIFLKAYVMGTVVASEIISLRAYRNCVQEFADDVRCREFFNEEDLRSFCLPKPLDVMVLFDELNVVLEKQPKLGEYPLRNVVLIALANAFPCQ